MLNKSFLKSFIKNKLAIMVVLLVVPFCFVGYKFLKTYVYYTQFDNKMGAVGDNFRVVKLNENAFSVIGSFTIISEDSNSSITQDVRVSKFYPNQWAAESKKSQMSQINNIEVWVSSKHPERGFILFKAFPTKELVYLLLIVAVFIYFVLFQWMFLKH